MIHSISVDVEEYFHAANLEPEAPPSSWRRLPSRVVESTERTLECFARCAVHGTFFVLGCVAKRHPELIKKIASAGHEIASHGYSHRLAFTQTPKQFLRDVVRSKRLLEDLSGRAVLGYRAPNFSIQPDNSWAYDALIEAGYIYDSSLYPTWHPRYSNLRQPIESFVEKRAHGELFIFPLAVAELNAFRTKVRLPAAGGAYWRLLPEWYCHGVLRARQRRSRSGFHCYFHPWELDAGQPVFTKLSFMTKLRHYGGAETFEKRVEHFLRSFSFAPLSEVALQTFGEDFARRADAKQAAASGGSVF